MISPTYATKMQAALSRLQADADASEAAVPNVLERWWSGAIGAESSATAAAELARKARQDADRFEARMRDLLSSATATDADAARFIGEAGDSYGVGAAGVIEEASDLLSPFTAVTETVKETAADIVAGVKGLAPWALGGLALGAVVVVGLLVRGRK